MRPIGYLYKQVNDQVEWLKAEHVKDVYSLSGHVSANFADYINYWQHNGYWLFNSPGLIRQLAAEHSITLSRLKLFYYEAYEREYDADSQEWYDFEPEASFDTDVVLPASKILEGFDVVTFSVGTSPECSPLSCNALAQMLPTNEHCLFQSFDLAKSALEEGKFKNGEPGPYRIIAVFSVDDA